VNDSKAGRCRELGPVGGLAQPVNVEAKEVVDSGTRVHQRIGKEGRRMEDRVA